MMDKLKIQFIVLFLFCLAPKSVYSQNNLEWVTSVSGTGTEYCHKLKADNLGNVYLIGGYTGAASLETSSTNTHIMSQGQQDGFVAKYNSVGESLWVQSFGGDTMDSANDLFIDNSGNCYVVGQFRGVMYTAIDTFKTAGASDFFVAKIDNQGTVIWSRSFGGAGFDNGTSIVSDNSGHLYISGYTSDTLSLSDSVQLIGNASLRNTIFKMSDSGDSIYWARTANDYYAEYSHLAISNDGGVIWAVNNNQEFLTKIDSNGGEVWKSSNSNGQVKSIVLDHNGAIYTIGPGKSKSTFITKQDSLGANLWSKYINTGETYPDAVTVDLIGRVHITGYFIDTVDFDPEESEYLVGAKDPKIFLLTLEENGEFLSLEAAGSGSFNGGCGLITNKYGELFASGIFSDTLILDERSPDLYVTAAGRQDGYLAKYACKSIRDSFQYELCNNESVTSKSGRYQWSDKGVYYDTIFRESHCPDYLVYSVSSNFINTEVERTDVGFESNSNQGMYQWYRCDFNPPRPIFGETNRTISNETPGNQTGWYMVEVSYKDCTDTSDCHELYNLNVDKNGSSYSVNVSPNPCAGMINIVSDQLLIGVVTIVDQKGVVLSRERVHGAVKHSMETNAEAGLYYIQFQSDNGGIYWYKKVLVL